MSETESSGSSAKLTTEFKIAPKASQNFLIAKCLLAGLCIACAAGLLFMDNAAGWAFIAFAGAILGVASWEWHRSQPDVDLHQATATTVTLSDGTSIATDSRTLRSPTASAALLKLCEAYQRVPLPEPDGLVENGRVIPNSGDRAIRRASAVNAVVAEQGARFDAMVNPNEHMPTATQHQLPVATPSSHHLAANADRPAMQ